MDTAKAKLTIINRELSPDEISERIGVPWDEARRVGEPKGRSGTFWGENVWWLQEALNSDQDGSVDEALGKCIERLRGRVGSAAPLIRALAVSEFVELGLYMLAQAVPPVHLGPDTVRFIGELGAELDIDITLYGDVTGDSLLP